MTMKTRYFATIMILLSFTNAAEGQFDKCNDPGLLAVYAFIGGARDMTANANHAVLHGPTLTEDRFTNRAAAMRFDGVDDYIDIGTRMKPQFPMTIAGWIRTASLQQNTTLFRNDRFDFPGNYFGVAITIEQNGNIAVHVGDGGNRGIESRRSKTTIDAVIAPNEWYHVVFVLRNQNNMAIYVNGVETLGSYDGGGGTLAYSTSPGALGMRMFESMPARHFRGDVDELSVYDRALSTDEIKASFSSANPVLSDADGDGFNDYEEARSESNPCDPRSFPVLMATIRYSEVEICWNSETNKLYSVLYQSELTTNAWVKLATEVPGTGTTNCITDAVSPGQPRRYYRVEESQ